MLLLLTTSRNPGKNKIMAKLKISLWISNCQKKQQHMNKTHKKGSAALRKNWRMSKHFSTVLWYRCVSRSKKAVWTCKAKRQFVQSSRALTVSLKQHQRDTNKVFALWRHASVISLKDMLVIIRILCMTFLCMLQLYKFELNWTRNSQKATLGHFCDLKLYQGHKSGI